MRSLFLSLALAAALAFAALTPGSASAFNPYWTRNVYGYPAYYGGYGYSTGYYGVPAVSGYGYTTYATPYGAASSVSSYVAPGVAAPFAPGYSTTTSYYQPYVPAFGYAPRYDRSFYYAPRLLP